MLVWSRVYPPPPLVTYIPTFSISPSFFRSGLRNPSYPANTPNRVYLSWLTPPTPCFNNVYNQLYTSLSVSLHLASAYTPYSFVPSIETISICLNVMWNQDEYTLHTVWENSRSASTKRGIIPKEGNQNENRKPVPWDRDPATFNCLIFD